MNGPYPSQYGFGALRCAIDNYNGDNVEYIAYPLGARHVFCFAYYVTPPPTSGTIVVRKQLDAPPDVAEHRFQFEGNLSFNADGRFALTAAPGRPSAQTFYRAAVSAGGTPWRLHEIAEPGWALIDHSCVSQTGASRIGVPAESADAEIALAAGDTVTCTYRNGLEPAPSGLTVGKATRGTAGRTDFLIRGPGLQAEAPVTTTAVDVPVYERLPPLPPGATRSASRPWPSRVGTGSAAPCAATGGS
ncbi:hypothetical protein DVA67_025145 [Solirubrobacter sp. CPCC 204708]|uniref:SpaA-like prealbumin fold domain-containing protein n=1 Tax=Solirubrobacter deserti TaxID=2282478 RepID=A0ABT4RRE6_9ACTN|nr:hypothetical protein [Solirubrobacter deserti]MBE2319288.1 hypothetical protein [Solirubrobacter deserti]MDA0141154.1 hypothetical protein [Solirubrobacter deserti]